MFAWLPELEHHIIVIVCVSSIQFSSSDYRENINLGERQSENKMIPHFVFIADVGLIDHTTEGSSR